MSSPYDPTPEAELATASPVIASPHTKPKKYAFQVLIASICFGTGSWYVPVIEKPGFAWPI